MKKTAVVTASVLAALLLGGYTGFAADSVYELNPVVVTATRTPVKMNDAPANISVISGKELEKEHYSDLSQALRNVSDTYIGNYGSGVGYETSNNLYINGNNNVVWMVDGIVMNITGVNAPVTAIKSMDNIDHIEVLKGAASALYGSSAVGGAINIITKKPENGVHATVRAMGGSYSQEQYAVKVDGAEEGWHWRANYQKDLMGDYKDAHGLKVPQHLNAKTYGFEFGKSFDDNNDVSIYYDKYDSKMKYADSNMKLNKRKHGIMKNESWRGVWRDKINDAWDNRFTLMDNDYKSIVSGTSTYAGYVTKIKSKGIADQATWHDDYNVVTGGFDWHQDNVTSASSTSIGKKLTNMSYYIQDAWKFAPQWTLTPGIRLDHHSAFGSHSSPHVSLMYEFNKDTNAYVAYNKYFIAPTASNLYSARYGNPNMKPETGHSWEFGVNHQFSDTMAGQMSFFTRKSTDKIGYSYAVGRYANIDTEKAHGFNLDLRKQFTPELSAHFGYTYTHVDGTKQRAINVDGYIPKHSVVVGVSYDKEKWDASLDVRGNIDRPGPKTADVSSLANNHFFPKNTYWITDLAVNYHPTANVTIFGKVNNLFDVFYAEQSNARAQWGGQPDEWWTSPGRNYQLGVQLKF